MSEVEQPGTSRQSQKIVLNDSANQSILDLSEPVAEEKLIQNPVIQQMMQKFFRDEFQNMQKEQQTHSREVNKNRGMLPDKTIKLPSDTTIYAPALQQRLTPNNTGGLYQQNQITTESSGVWRTNNNNCNVNKNKLVICP